jgi:RimJ/RimL family protein N-acetyltransferase
MKAQTNDALLTAMLHLWARDIKSEKIVFHDRMTTVLPPPDAALHREGSPGGEFFLEIEGAVVATGGIMFHYNRPYADIYMRVEEKFRMRGLGSYLVQELKKACYLGGSIPCARCDPDNIASRKTLQKAGFVPCAHILTGSL